MSFKDAPPRLQQLRKRQGFEGLTCFDLFFADDVASIFMGLMASMLMQGAVLNGSNVHLVLGLNIFVSSRKRRAISCGGRSSCRGVRTGEVFRRCRSPQKCG